MSDTYEVRCLCGWETTGDEAGVVQATQAHGREIHNMDTTPEQVMAMASRVES